MSEKKHSREIDIIGLLKRMLAEKKTLAKFVGVFAVIGVVVALNTPKRYTTSVVLAPELTSGSSLTGGLSSLASMVGVNLGSVQGGMDAIYPQIYPDVLTSSDFLLKLFDVKVQQYEDTVTKTYSRHLAEDGKVPFWDYPMIWLGRLMADDDETAEKGGEPDPFRLTKKENGILNAIRANVACIVDKNTSVISISVSDMDRNVCAIMADTIQRQLQKYITIYRTQKARNDVEYAEKLYAEAKAAYLAAQQAYSSYADANTELMLEAYKAKLNDLENEMQLKYNIYSQVAQQLQLAKAKVQEQTPAFSVIQGASVPLQASSFPRSFMVLIYMFFGVALDALWILYLRDWYRNWRAKRAGTKGE